MRNVELHRLSDFEMLEIIGRKILNVENTSVKSYYLEDFERRVYTYMQDLVCIIFFKVDLTKKKEIFGTKYYWHS